MKEVSFSSNFERKMMFTKNISKDVFMASGSDILSNPTLVTVKTNGKNSKILVSILITSSSRP